MNSHQIQNGDVYRVVAGRSQSTEDSQPALPYDMADGYNPELEEKDNPLYFQINQVLFDAHKERAERSLTKFPDL